MVSRMVFCTEISGVLRTVNVNRNGDGWYVNANEVSNPNTWHDGNQVFSRNYCFSPVISWREFCFAIFLSSLFSIHQAFCLPLQALLRCLNILRALDSASDSDCNLGAFVLAIVIHCSYCYTVQSNIAKKRSPAEIAG